MALLWSAPAVATTGPTPLAHPPRFNVTAAEAAPYLGRFTLVKPHGPQLISGAYVAGINERHFVEGTIEIYTYDSEGRETVVLGRTYEYRALGDRMEIDIISPENQVILARMKLHPAGGGRLTGNERSLVPAKKPERITLAPASRAASAAAEATPEAAPEGATESRSPPPAEDTSAVVLAAVRRIFGF